MFFDKIGVEWEYEPVSVQTDQGQVTPDFILRTHWCDQYGTLPTIVLFEVKPSSFNLSDARGVNLMLRYRLACDHILLEDRAEESVGWLVAAGDPCDMHNRIFNSPGSGGAMFGEVLIDAGAFGEEGADRYCVSDFAPHSFKKEGWDTDDVPVISDVMCVDYADEAAYARQYDFMHYLPN